MTQITAELPHAVILSEAKDLFLQMKGEILRPPRRAQNDTASKGLGDVLITAGSEWQMGSWFALISPRHPLFPTLQRSLT